MRTTMGETKKRQRRKGRPSDDGPDNPFTVGEPSQDLTTGCRDDQPGGGTGEGEEDR